MSSVSFSNQVERLLYKLIRNYEECNRVCISQLGVTTAQAYTLLALPQRQSLAMNELSDAMGLAGSTMTRMVDQLVGKHLVGREQDEHDRRVVRVVLTARGEQVRSTLRQLLDTFFSQVLDQVPEEEHASILRSLDRLNQAISQVVTDCCGE
jgi:MarR family transcriptional regulator, organic hydroperoxide resistance regulator